MMEGALMPAALPGLVGGKDLPIYAPNNLGRPYKIGYILGLNTCGTIYFGIAFWQTQAQAVIFTKIRYTIYAYIGIQRPHSLLKLWKKFKAQPVNLQNANARSCTARKSYIVIRKSQRLAHAKPSVPGPVLISFVSFQSLRSITATWRLASQET